MRPFIPEALEHIGRDLGTAARRRRPPAHPQSREAQLLNSCPATG